MLSRKEIVRTCGLSDLLDLAETLPNVMPAAAAPSGKILMIANDNDPTAYSQAKNLEAQLLKARPQLNDVLELQDGDVLSYTQPPDQFLIFLTDNIFMQPTVCQVLMSALQRKISLIFVAEADMRYNAVGIPLMGGSIAEELIKQAPIYIKRDCQGLLASARPVPFYPVKLFREASINQILKEMHERRLPALTTGATAAVAHTCTDIPDLGPEILALIDKMEREKDAALAEKDELLRELEGQRLMELQQHGGQLQGLREALRLTAIWE
jgi:hypothetical protein